jgi:hypothetical protein
MNDIENLNERVEKAVRNFRDSEEKRRNENRSLSGILNDLEIKFEARSAELEDCHDRIRELEASNVSLNALVCQLVEIVENTADEAAHDPVYRARSAATDIVDRFVNGKRAGDRAAPQIAAAPQPAPQSVPQRAPQAAPKSDARALLAEGRFEDIEDEFRLAEDLYEKTEGATEFPKLVYDAVALAAAESAGPPMAEMKSSGLSESEPAAEVTPGGDLDIKEIMARLEMAAERAQLRADEDARRDRAAETEQKQARTA